MTDAVPTGTYPRAIFVRKADGGGFGFTYLSRDDFARAADSFLGPIEKTIAAKMAEGKAAPGDEKPLRLAAALSFLGQLFDGSLEEMFSADAVRWIAAACVRECFLDGEFPAAVTVEDDDGQVGVRAGDEFLDDAGFPRAVVIGAVEQGGGRARFFDDAESFAAAAGAEPTEADWLPQILHRLYERMPPVMMGLPKRDESSGGVGLECTPLAFGRDIPGPVERAGVAHSHDHSHDHDDGGDDPA